MSLFGKKTKINDSSAEKAAATKTVKAEKMVAKPAKATKALAKVEAKSESKATKREAAVAGVSFPKNSPIVRPRVTEKAGLLSQKGIYTFDVRTDATENSVSQAITAAYKVEPVKVNLASIKAKTMFTRGKMGKTTSGKKAYVFLKKGDTIEFI